MIKPLQANLRRLSHGYKPYAIGIILAISATNSIFLLLKYYINLSKKFSIAMTTVATATILLHFISMGLLLGINISRATQSQSSTNPITKKTERALLYTLYTLYYSGLVAILVPTAILVSKNPGALNKQMLFSSIPLALCFLLATLVALKWVANKINNIEEATKAKLKSSSPYLLAFILVFLLLTGVSIVKFVTIQELAVNNNPKFMTIAVALSVFIILTMIHAVRYQFISPNIENVKIYGKTESGAQQKLDNVRAVKTNFALDAAFFAMYSLTLGIASVTLIATAIKYPDVASKNFGFYAIPLILGFVASTAILVYLVHNLISLECDGRKACATDNVQSSAVTVEHDAQKKPLLVQNCSVQNDLNRPGSVTNGAIFEHSNLPRGSERCFESQNI